MLTTHILEYGINYLSHRFIEAIDSSIEFYWTDIATLYKRGHLLLTSLMWRVDARIRSIAGKRSIAVIRSIHSIAWDAGILYISHVIDVTILNIIHAECIKRLLSIETYEESVGGRTFITFDSNVENFMQYNYNKIINFKS